MNELQRASGDLIIQGTSLTKEFDNHIISAIKKSKINKIAYGIFDKSNLEQTKQDINALLYKKDLIIDFYDSSTFIP